MRLLMSRRPRSRLLPNLRRPGPVPPPPGARPSPRRSSRPGYAARLAHRYTEDGGMPLGTNYLRPRGTGSAELCIRRVVTLASHSRGHRSRGRSARHEQTNLLICASSDSGCQEKSFRIFRNNRRLAPGGKLGIATGK